MKKIIAILFLILAFILIACRGENSEEISDGIEVQEEISQEEEEIVEPEPLCDNPFVDPRDEREYCTVEIGEQTWMTQNMNYDSGCTGVNWRDTHDEGWCGCYEEDEDNCETYSKLYQWSVANEICPEGWRLPTDSEWSNLMTFLGTSPAAKLKDSTFNGNNSSGFSVIPGGNRAPGGEFQNIQTNAYFWSSDESSDTRAWGRHFIDTHSGVYRLALEKAFAFSVRCIQDQEEEI